MQEVPISLVVRDEVKLTATQQRFLDSVQRTTTYSFLQRERRTAQKLLELGIVRPVLDQSWRLCAVRL